MISGYIKQLKALVIMKLERDEGARLLKNDKSHTIDIEQVRDLMLTKKTQVFKVALFVNSADAKIDFDGFINDAQATGYRHLIATFFLRFLGCKMLGDLRVLTKEFVDASMKFIQKIDDPITKAKYYGHLNSYANNNEKIISPKDFAIKYLEVEDRKNYENFLEESGVNMDSFGKDVELVKRSITKRLYEFDNGISLSVEDDGDNIEDKISLTATEDSKVKAEFTAKLKRIGS